MEPNKGDMTQSKEQLASHYALHVALQTMKERCLSLQQRLTAVEEDNAELRKKFGQDEPHRSATLDARSECEQLSEQVGELTRQKYQLTEHKIFIKFIGQCDDHDNDGSRSDDGKY